MAKKPAEEEETSDKSDAPAKAPSMVETVKAYRDLVIGVGAMLAALAGILKPTDTTATEQSFDHTQASLKQLSADNAKTHDDLVRLHKFVVAYVDKHNKLEQYELQILQQQETAPSPSRPRSSSSRARTSGARGTSDAFYEAAEAEAADPDSETAAAIAAGHAAAQEILDELSELPALPDKPAVFKEQDFEDVIDE